MTSKCIESVLLLSASTHIFPTICLVHNGSSAENVEKLVHQYPKLNHTILTENIGFSGGANVSINQAHKISEWALFLSNDCLINSWPSPGNFSNEPCILAPLVHRRKGTQIDSFGGVFIPAKAQLIHFKSPTDIANFKSSWRSLKYVPGSCFLIHKKISDNTSGFDERLGTYWEDVDLSLRAQQLGFALKFDPHWSVEHKVGRTCHGNPLYTLFYFQRNRKRMVIAYARWYELPLASMFLVRDWTRIALRLIKTKRCHDLNWLRKAILEY